MASPSVNTEAEGPASTAAAQDDPARVWWSGALMEDLEARRWEPPFFKGTVRTYPEGTHLRLALKALAEPTVTVTVGDMSYRTSTALAAAGKEIFHNYHYGTHELWRLRRAIEWSTRVTDPGEYSRRFGIKRDGQGYLVGVVGVERPDGRVDYGHSCALCHANVTPDGTIVDGMANQDYDMGAHLDSLRPRIHDPDLILFGDAPLEAIRSQGAGRADQVMDGTWAPVRVPHLYALRAFQHGVGANGDMGNLWNACYRKLNESYAVESEIMEALLAYLLSLEAVPVPGERGALEARGEAVFQAQRCHRCHAPPYYSTGDVIDWSAIGTDPDRIRNGFPKGYKVPSLLRLEQYRFYLHDGSLTSLEQLFDPARLSTDASGIPAERRKKGVGVPGHLYGLRLSPAEREALLAYLRSL